ncbi:MAG: GGDEF domain-containing protein [Proteobacteria bacterium]|nr:GGDEF domain-containing protein [Pseudomonadota bacterium]MBU1611023.1 GGDEF domain-containing protein [Pseudomonadota bacterium]
MTEDLFKREATIIRHAEDLAASPDNVDNPLLPEFQSLLGHYMKLLNQAKRLVKMSDRMQGNLNILNEQLEHLSSIDGLTGIPNRRHFDEVLETELKRAYRDKMPLSVIMVDIDYFKAYNDQYGHMKGDKCLRLVAQTLSEAPKRPTEIVGRYGGEEFVAALPNTGMQGALIVAERMRTMIQDLDIPHESSPIASQVTLSFGVACETQYREERGAESLIQAADQMLYEAKRLGRNRVHPVCSDDTP